MKYNVLMKNLGIYGANTYVLYDDKKEALIIDCGGDPEDVVKLLEDNGLKAVAIVVTHGHFDHIAGVEKLRELLGVKVYGAEREKDLFDSAQNNLSFKTLVGPVTLKPDVYFKDGDELKFGDIILKVMETPGHTEGSVCLYNDSMIFTGDTIFRGNIGRTDLYSGSQVKMNESLKRIRDHFQKDLIVYPGHGAASTIEFEVKNNPYIVSLV